MPTTLKWWLPRHVLSCRGLPLQDNTEEGDQLEKFFRTHHNKGDRGLSRRRYLYATAKLKGLGFGTVDNADCSPLQSIVRVKRDKQILRGSIAKMRTVIYARVNLGLVKNRCKEPSVLI